MEPVVRQLDHIFASVADPREPYGILEGLGFPVAWPVVKTEAFTSGGFFLANLKIEFTFFEGDVFNKERPPLNFTGLAFEPIPLDRAVSLLDKRGIAHTAPIPIGSFTNCFITDRFPSFYVFLCEYDLETYPWNDPVSNRGNGEAHSINSAAARWAYYRTLIQNGAGGPLGLVSANELLIGTPDLSDAAKRWDAFVTPATKSAPHAWHLPPGPSIRLVEAPREQVLGLEIGVQSLDAAIDFLREKRCLGEVRDSEVRIDPEAVSGLDLRLVPSPQASK